MSQTPEEATATTASESPNVTVATGTLPAEQDKKTAKVELDIEDAPFLKESPKPPEEAQPQKGKSAEAKAEDESESPKKNKKKLFLIAGAAGLVLVVGIAAAFFLLTGPSTVAPPPPPLDDPSKPEVIVVPSKPVTAASPDIVKDFDRFIVPVGNSIKNTNFLICKFSTVTKNPGLEAELDQKMLTLRDAVYFYLRSKSFDYLLDPKNAPEVKKDLAAIVNDYLTVGKLEDVLLDTYLGH